MPTYKNKETGEIVTAGKNTRSFTAEDRVPPFLPINWVDWLRDGHVREMNAAMRGVYLSILIELWMYDQCSPDHKVLARRIGLDPRPVRAFLERYRHLFRCTKCDGVMTNLVRESDGSTTEVRRKYDDSMTQLCRNCDGSMTNRKLRNYKNDVKNGLPLGTTEPNLYPNQTEPESNLNLLPAGQEEEENEEINDDDADYDELG